MFRWWLLAVAVIAWAEPDIPGPDVPSPSVLPPRFQLDRRPIPGGGELITVFGRLPEASHGVTDPRVPLLAMVRDPRERDGRLRYVWVLTSSRPTPLQRAAAATPFFYWRAGLGKSADQTPRPLLDLSAASSRVWTAMGGSLAQVMALDANGTLLRSSSRSYRNNSRDYDQIHLLEGLAVVSQLEFVPDIHSALNETELLELHARLNLAGQMLGGLVSESKLTDAYRKLRIRTTMERGHNWELLRQRAEANGLYFEPFGLNGSATQALLWVAREDVEGERSFDGQFLNVANPHGDERLKNWKGYTVRRDGKELIPLGLYSLDHPKIPLLLVDFRDTRAPRRREMTRHAAVDVVSGVIGYSKWADWPYFAGTWAWDFVHSRRGAANNRRNRLRAYAQVRQWLVLDPSLDPTLRLELLKRLEGLGANPLDDNMFDKAKFAQRQYAALLRYAENPNGLSRKLGLEQNAKAKEFGRGTIHAIQ